MDLPFYREYELPWTSDNDQERRFRRLLGMVFGVALTLIACRQGFYAQGGAAGVGRATNRAVVQSAIAILVLAWAIKETCQAVDTSGYLVATLAGDFDPALLPLAVFLLAALTAFSRAGFLDRLSMANECLLGQ